MIVPELAGAAAHELDALRAACDAAIASLYASGARSVLVVGSGAVSAVLPLPAQGSFAPWGVPVAVRIGGPADTPEAVDAEATAAVGGGAAVAVGGGDAPALVGAGIPAAPQALPLSLLTGAWLLHRAPAPSGMWYRAMTVGAGEPIDRCRLIGEQADVEHPWALLAMGDGSACRGPQAPGYDDPRAVPYDESVARALADADVAALLSLDPSLGAELLVAGRAPWQVLAGAVQATGRPWRGDLLHQSSPYGVSYFVASWTPGDPAVRR